MNHTSTTFGPVLDFWFGNSLTDSTTASERNNVWFGTDETFDQNIRNRFSALIEHANDSKLDHWGHSPHGTLALILILDQFPRNVYRGKPRAYAYDQRALSLTKEGIALCADLELRVIERIFFYMPLEHAEDINEQDTSVGCFKKLHSEAPQKIKPLTDQAVQHAIAHRAIIKRFGRFPHRNPALKRTSTTAEREWLAANSNTYGQR